MANETKSTPGPWMATPTLRGDTVSYWEIGPIGADGKPDWEREVCATADDNEANARLLAAAPEMLAQLEYWIGYVALDPKYAAWTDKTRSVIAKAMLKESPDA